MSIVSAPAVDDLAGNERASRLSERIRGKRIAVTLESANPRVRVVWNGILRDGSNYLRQEITVQAPEQDLPIAEIKLVAWKLPDVKVRGTVAGSPVVAGGIFAGFEHRLSKCSIAEGIATCSLLRELPLRATHEVKFSSVIGVTPANQLRRGFLNYVERERAHPYRTFLHYNTWYDLGYFGRFDQAGVLDRLNIIGTQLNKLRGVKVDSFLLDDGWDDPKSLWHFDSGFPQGLTPLTEAAAKYGAAPGIWMSPWGGYGQPHAERMKYGMLRGFEANEDGFALSGPEYYQYFHDICVEMISKYGINQFNQGSIA
jgi:hypothetical protein